MRVSIEVDDEDRAAIGRMDGKPGPARREDVRQFLLGAMASLLAGEWRDELAWPESG